MLNILVPMAGKGNRFLKEGYTLPKPLITVNGKTMVSIVVNNLRPKIDHQFIFLVLKEHDEKYGISQTLKDLSPNCIVIKVDTVTEGAACTCLLAKEYIDNNDELMIANSDQWVDVDINKYLESMKGIDGLIMTMWANDPKWSYVKIKGEYVSEVVEKMVVSNDATVGVYNYRKGSMFVEAVQNMIRKDFRVNGEFYVAPAYNEMIAKNHKIKIYNVGKELDGMYGLGIPSDLRKFESMKEICNKATNF